MSIYTFHNELTHVLPGDLSDQDELILFDASANRTVSCSLGELLAYIGAAGAPGDTRTGRDPNVPGRPGFRPPSYDRVRSDEDKPNLQFERDKSHLRQDLEVGPEVHPSDEDDHDHEGRHNPRAGRKAKGE